MKTIKWCCVNYRFGANGEPMYAQDTIRYRRSDSIDAFIEGSGSPWKHWRDKIKWKCVKIEVEIKQVTTP